MLEESASAIPSSLWASMNSWFTPAVLFVLLNLMIGTIAITSSFSNQKQGQNKQSHNDFHQPNVARSPSVLQRLKSVNFYSHFRSQEPLDSSLHYKQNPDSDALDAQAHYFFQGNSHENGGESVHQSQAHYAFEQAREKNPPEGEDRFDFEERDSNFEDFQMAREENVEESSEQSMDEVYSQLTGSHVVRTKSDTEPASGQIPAKLPSKMRKSASVKSAFAHFEEEDIVEVRRPATVKEKGNAKMADVDEEVDAKADDFINKFKQQLKLQRLDSIIRYKDMIGRVSGGR